MHLRVVREINCLTISNKLGIQASAKLIAMNLSCEYMGYTYANDRIYNTSFLLLAMLPCLLLTPTFAVNLAMIIVIVKKQVFHSPPFVLIANMALSDFLSSCTSFICYSITCVYFLSGRDPCAVAVIGTPLAYIFCCTSFFCIVLQSVERYLAIFYPFWYLEKLTTSIVLYLNCLVWAISISLVGVLMISKNNQLFNGIVGIVALPSLVATIIIYALIFKEVKRIENMSICKDVVTSPNDGKFQSESKVSKATAIILVVFVTCFGPLILLNFSTTVMGRTTYSAHVALYWCWFLALVNSFLNPFVICRQLTVLRRPVTNILCFWKQTRTITPQRVSTFQDEDLTKSCVSRVMPRENELLR